MNRKNLLTALFAAVIVCAAGTSSAFAKDDVAKPVSCCGMACCKPGAACCDTVSKAKKPVAATAKKATPVAKTLASVAPVK
ncbi:MAG: hypothetical protein H7Y38_14460 [Armatimonadetes bacterium]|nr:hypothetical protein [Armatimonadota bacterium]